MEEEIKTRTITETYYTTNCIDCGEEVVPTIFSRIIVHERCNKCNRIYRQERVRAITESFIGATIVSVVLNPRDYNEIDEITVQKRDGSYVALTTGCFGDNIFINYNKTTFDNDYYETQCGD